MIKYTLLLCILVCSKFGFTQQCSNYFLLKEGSKIELQNLDKKGNVSTVLKYNVQQLKQINNGFAIQMLTETYDPKGKLIVKGEVNGKCQNGDLYTDVQNISSSMFSKSQDLKMNIDGDQLVYPANMKVGDILKDAKISVSASLSTGMSLMNMSVNITNRKVEGTETVETPAGKFECIKMSYDLNMKMIVKKDVHVVEYFFKGLGIVKSDTYDAKGKLESSLVLSKLDK